MAVTNATLLVGDSGSGKTSLLATLAEWVWKTYKKVSLLYSTDGGGFPAKMDALIRAGIVRVWKLRTRGEAFESCSRACQAYWPTEFTNPLAGEVPPGVSLIPSITATYTLRCDNCNAEIVSHSNKKGFKQFYICKCSNKVSRANGIVEEEIGIAPFFKDVGAVMIDGLTSMNDWIMGDMSDMGAKGVLKGETAAIGGKIVSGDMVFGGPNRSHYGFAQTRSMQWVQDASNIQGLIVGTVFTSRLQRATDTNSNIRVYGPQIAGQAKTADIPAWVGNCLGADIMIDEKGRKEWRLYLTEYMEPGDDVVHLCKTRAAPGTMPDYLSDGPINPKTGKPDSGVEPFTEFNLGHFMELMETATKKTLEDTVSAYPDAPGHSYLKEAPKKEKQEIKTESTETKPKPKPAIGVARPTAPVAAKPGPKNGPNPKPVTKPVPVKKGPGRPRKNPVPRPGK
ncbi:MAG: hypothetical protein ACW987_19190 [Candidatus Thorarchaeota archaeon]|jgi:energy-coupling factor transporter ATP-binding protein EcfA2